MVRLAHVLAIVALGAGSLSSAIAQHAMEPANHPQPHAAPEALSADLPYHGQVRSIDLKHHKVTLRHGPLVPLGMSAMTMEYLVADEKALQGIKPRDNVRFDAQRLHGAFVLTGIEKEP